MNRSLSMNIMRGSLLAALALLFTACGGKESVASKSAAAYREAQAKGIPVAGGHEHGGHAPATTTVTGAAAEMDHSAHETTADAHAGHDRSAGAAATDHGAHAAMSASDHAAMGHGTTAASADHAAHQQPATVAQVDHSQHGATAPPPAATAPPSNAEMRSLQPASTLEPDVFDTPAPVSVAEAARATPAKPAAAAVYACPMHPEVTSDQPGTCPKCGMTLVKKNGS